MLGKLEKQELDEERAKNSQEFEKMQEKLALESEQIQKHLEGLFLKLFILFL